jgi:hypothetical protein
VKEAKPTPKPRIIRDPMRKYSFGDSEHNNAPITKITALIRIAPFLPYLFERTPLIRVPKTAPQRRELTTNSRILFEIEKSFSINTSAPEMTPISRPKSNPARAAVIPMK